MTQPAWDSEDLIAPVDQWPPELGGDYEHLGELGRGGMAVVFRAMDRELGREVAVKVVRPRLAADDEAVARVAREARTVAKLEHPHIVGVYSVRRLSEGTIALIMQLVPGRTLKAELANGPLDPIRAERVLRDIGAALAYAHKAGVVHRDVKPENIFLDEVSGRALLSDFGVARVMDAPTELTATGTTIGTPSYMAPEQIDGVNIDTRSDLYSLGIVGWEMLTGERPWAGETLYNVIYRQKHDPLPPIDTFRADVPPKLQYLIEGLMHKKPDRRWSSAGLFITLLSSDKPPPGLQQWQAIQERRKQSEAFLQSLPLPKSGDQQPQETLKFVRPLREDGGPTRDTKSTTVKLPLVSRPSVGWPPAAVAANSEKGPSTKASAPAGPAPTAPLLLPLPQSRVPAATLTTPASVKDTSVSGRREGFPLLVKLSVLGAAVAAALIWTLGFGRGSSTPRAIDAAVTRVPAPVKSSPPPLDTAAMMDSLFRALAREDAALRASSQSPLGTPAAPGRGTNGRR